MEVDEGDCKLKVEIKEEYENNEDNKVICHSLIGYIKKEEPCSQDEYLLSIDSKAEVETLEYKNLLECKIKNEDLLDDKKILKIVIKDCKDTFIKCLKESIFKIAKSDASVNEKKGEDTHVISEETSWGNSFENEESSSEENLQSIECVDHNIPKSSNNIEKSSSKTKKQYFKPRKFICQYCNKGFPQSDVLKYHIMSHTGEMPNECSYCYMRFIRKTSLNRHLQVHTSKKFVCKVCNKRFVSNYNLKLHNLIHENKKQFKCALCQSAYNTRFALYSHINSIHQKTPLNGTDEGEKFECGHCNKKYLSKEFLTAHIKNTHYHCKICGVESENKYCLNHETIEKNDSYTCFVCKSNFTDGNLFKQHINNVHKTYKPYGCRFCNASFKNKSNLTAHILVRHESHEKKFVCDVCNMGFYRETYLKRHVKIHTKSDRTFSCDLCDIKCRSKTDIRRHIETHFGRQEKGHLQCEYCDLTFSKQCKLSRHIIVHTGERPFKCNLCEKTYKDSCSLKLHLNQHQGQTYTCDKCGFLSVNERSFKRHLRQKICRKEKLPCEVCGKYLTSKKFYKNHMTRCHSENGGGK